eukprot:15468650-Alexandrium_andersonii.AAC.1
MRQTGDVPDDMRDVGMDKSGANAPAQRFCEEAEKTRQQDRRRQRQRTERERWPNHSISPPPGGRKAGA